MGDQEAQQQPFDARKLLGQYNDEGVKNAEEDRLAEFFTKDTRKRRKKIKQDLKALESSGQITKKEKRRLNRKTNAFAKAAIQDQNFKEDIAYANETGNKELVKQLESEQEKTLEKRKNKNAWDEFREGDLNFDEFKEKAKGQVKKVAKAKIDQKKDEFKRDVRLAPFRAKRKLKASAVRAKAAMGKAGKETIGMLTNPEFWKGVWRYLVISIKYALIAGLLFWLWKMFDPSNPSRVRWSKGIFSKTSKDTPINEETMRKNKAYLSPYVTDVYHQKDALEYTKSILSARKALVEARAALQEGLKDKKKLLCFVLPDETDKAISRLDDELSKEEYQGEHLELEEDKYGALHTVIDDFNSLTLTDDMSVLRYVHSRDYMNNPGLYRIGDIVGVSYDISGLPAANEVPVPPSKIDASYVIQQIRNEVLEGRTIAHRVQGRTRHDDAWTVYNNTDADVREEGEGEPWGRVFVVLRGLGLEATPESLKESMRRLESIYVPTVNDLHSIDVALTPSAHLQMAMFVLFVKRWWNQGGAERDAMRHGVALTAMEYRYREEKDRSVELTKPNIVELIRRIELAKAVIYEYHQIHRLELKYYKDVGNGNTYTNPIASISSKIRRVFNESVVDPITYLSTHRNRLNMLADSFILTLKCPHNFRLSPRAAKKLCID